MWLFQTKEQLTDAEVKRGLSAIVKDGVASQAMATLTSGVFLVAFALQLGASNLIIGLLAAIPALLQLIQIPSIFLIERIQNRRFVCFYASLLSRMPWLFIAISPLFLPHQWGLTIVLIGLFIYSSFEGMSGCAWNSWMRDIVPQERMGDFFSRRMQLTTLCGLLISFFAGVFIDWWKMTYGTSDAVYGYSVLFFIGFFAGLVSIYYIGRIPEPKMKFSKIEFLKTLSLPFQDRNFKRLLVFLGSWSFAINLATPFFTVFMLKELGLNMVLVVTFTILCQIFNFVFLNVWGRFVDRFSNKSVLLVSGPLYIVSIVAWAFVEPPDKHPIYYLLLMAIHSFMGIATAGVTLATANIGLKLAPKGKATSYLAASTIINSLGAGIAPILGGNFADFFAMCDLSLIVTWISPGTQVAFRPIDFHHWDFFFLLAFILGLYALHRLVMVQEEGDVGQQVVRNELVATIKEPFQNMANMTGFLQFLSIPISNTIKAIRENLIKTKGKKDES